MVEYHFTEDENITMKKNTAFTRKISATVTLNYYMDKITNSFNTLFI